MWKNVVLLRGKLASRREQAYLYPREIRAVNLTEDREMSIERMVLAIASSFILVSIAFSLIFSPYWLSFTGFVGANLFQSAFTGFCPLAKILKGSAQNRAVKPSSVRD